MRALVVYESMYGNTSAIAQHVAAGLRSGYDDVTVAPVRDVGAGLAASTDLLVVGGPTHVHGLSSGATRRSAVADAGKHPDLTTDAAAADPGLRDWLRTVPAGEGRSAAAFDTRFRAPAALTGRASRGVARRLRRHGFRAAVRPESFFVDKRNRLIDGEVERAQAWGEALARSARAAHQPAGH